MPGPTTPEGKKRAMANLRPPWKPGQSGNPEGRKTAGAYIQEWVNSFSVMTRAEVVAIRDDEGAPVAKRAAARCWIDSMSSERTRQGAPIAGPEMDRIMDRTEGRPKQSVDVTSGDEPLGPPMTFVVQEFPAPERSAADDKTPETPE